MTIIGPNFPQFTGYKCSKPSFWKNNGNGTWTLEFDAPPLPGANPDCPECHGVGWSTPPGCCSGECETCFPYAPKHLRINEP